MTNNQLELLFTNIGEYKTFTYLYCGLVLNMTDIGSRKFLHRAVGRGVGTDHILIEWKNSDNKLMYMFIRNNWLVRGL